MNDPAQIVIALLPQLLRFLEIRVVHGNFNVDALGEGWFTQEFFGPEFSEDMPPELERPDFTADARLGGDVSPTVNNYLRIDAHFQYLSLIIGMGSNIIWDEDIYIPEQTL